MESAEYLKLAALERSHWYYVGKRMIVREWLRRTGAFEGGKRLLDCGAGTGLFAEEVSSQCGVLVLDDHEEALRMLRERFRPEQILALAGDRIPVGNGELDCVTALDVLEHTPDDAAVVREFGRVLKPGGVAVVTVPASRALWSDWDVVLHHYRRYSRAELRGLFPSDAWEIVHVNYTNVFVYPAVWLMRRWRKWFGKNDTSRAEDRMPSAWMNSLLRWQFVKPAVSKVPLPIGVSLLLVARKR